MYVLKSRLNYAKIPCTIDKDWRGEEMKKIQYIRKLIVFILLFGLLITLVMLSIFIKYNNSLQEMYIRTSISEPLTRLANNMEIIKVELDEVISTREISLNELGNLKTNVIQTSQYLSDFKNSNLWLKFIRRLDNDIDM